MSEKVIRVPARLWNLVTRVGILFVVCLLIGSMITLFSPSVTLNMNVEERFLFWVLLCLIGGIGIFIADVILIFLDVDWSNPIRAFIQSISGATVILTAVYIVYEPAEIPPFSISLTFVWAVMVLILIGAFILGLAIDKTRKADAQTDTQTKQLPSTTPIQILNRLPVRLRSSVLYAIAAEDHYVRVYTSNGEDMILMRLSDAILETGGLDGLQTHRSWWVAKAGIKSVESRGRTAQITLKNDVKAPVSRDAVKLIKQAGWL